MNVDEKMREQIVVAGALAQQFTCQLFYNLKRIGSGFFIQVDDDYFLLSAAHVLEQAYIEGMRFPNGEELIPISGQLFITQPPEGLTRSSDQLDFSVIKLDKSTIAEVQKKFLFIPLDQIDIDHQPQNTPQYMLFGYPNEWTQVEAAEERFIPKPLIVRTKMVNPESLKMEKYENGAKFAVEYNQLNFISNDGNKEKKLPNATGMSGSALWYIPFKEFVNHGEINLRLVGLVTDYFGGWDNVIVATNIAVVTEAIREKIGVNLPKSETVKINIKE